MCTNTRVHERKSIYVICHTTLFPAMGTIYQEEENHIHRREYKKRYTLICFELSNLEENINYVNLRKPGIISLEVRFKKEFTETMNVVVYGDFENTIEIYKYRSVVIDVTLYSDE